MLRTPLRTTGTRYHDIVFDFLRQVHPKGGTERTTDCDGRTLYSKSCTKLEIL